MKRTLLTLFILSGALLINACAKSGSNNGNVAGTPNTCENGYLSSQYGCIPQGNCPTGQGFYNNQCINITSALNGPKYGASLEVLSRSTFEKFLSMTHATSSMLGGWGCQTSWAIGNQKCSYYSGTGYVIITKPEGTIKNNTLLQLRVGAGAETPYGYRNGSWGTYALPIETNIPVYYQRINNNQGFVLQDHSQLNFPNGRIRARVDSGSITADSFTVVLEYNGQDFARTTVYRF